MPQSASNNDQTLERLDDQIRWYDIHSGRQRRAFISLKVVTVVAAATIPLSAAIPPKRLLESDLDFVTRRIDCSNRRNPAALSIAD